MYGDLLIKLLASKYQKANKKQHKIVNVIVGQHSDQKAACYTDKNQGSHIGKLQDSCWFSLIQKCNKRNINFIIIWL